LHTPGFCAFIRHGERADDACESNEIMHIEEPNDPPLTKYGIL